MWLCVSVSAWAVDLPAFNVPLTFEKNLGQAPDAVQFIARSGQGVVFLTNDGITLSSTTNSQSPVLISFGRKADTVLTEEAPTGGVANYYTTNQKDWLTHIPVFSGVRYTNAYPGIDVLVHANEQNLEFDFEVSPGASVDDLIFGVQAAGKFAIAEDGALNISANSQTWRLNPPLAYQILHGEKRKVKTSYRLLPNNQVAIRVDKFDRTSKLIIDPVVEYSFIRTYPANFTAMQVDTDGNLILAGVTTSSVYPVVNGQSPNPSSPFDQAFVTKIDGATKAVMFSTFLPTSAITSISAMTFDPQGNIYVTGIANSSDFPVTSSNLGTCGQFCNTGFVSKFAPDGSLVYSTLLASGQILSRSIAVDADGNAYVTGDAHDASLQTTPGAYQPSYQGLQCTSCSNAFFAKLNPTGTGYVFASYLNGAGTLPAMGIVATGIALDASGNIYIGGAGSPTQLVQAWELAQGVFFLTKFAADGRTLQFATTFGGAPARVFPKMKLGPDGTIYFVGSIQSNDFPYTVNAAFHPVAPNDTSQFRDSIFVTAIDAGLKTLKYSTYLGDGFVNDFTVDSRNHLYLTGSNQLNRIPLLNPVASGSTNAGFFVELSGTGNPVMVSQFGAHQTSQIPSVIAVDSSHSIYLAGTVSGGLPPFGPDPLLVGPLCDGVPANKVQDWCEGQGGIFIAKINPLNQPNLVVTSPGPPWLGLFPPFFFIHNAGSSDLHISNIALSGGISQEFDNCGRTISAGVSCVISVTDSNGQLAGGTVAITSDAQPAVQSFTLIPPSYTPTQPIGDWPIFDDISFVFAPQLTGASSPTIPLRIWNLGTQNSKVDQVSAVGDVLQMNDCGVLTPGANCTVQVSVTPRSTDAINQLGIVYDTNINTASHTGDGGLNQSYFVSSVLAPQSLLLSVQGLSFGHQLVGGTAIPRAVTVTNTTNSPLPAPVVSLQGVSQFMIDGNSCTSTLVAYGSCAVAVKYVPTGNGNSSGTLMVSGQGATVHANLFATGEINSVVHPNPLQLDFFSWPVGHSLGLGLQLVNSTSSAIGITSIAVSQPDFTQTNSCKGQIPANGTCNLQVNFVPQTLGDLKGTITVDFAGGVVEQVIPLTGTGVTPLDISVSSLDFGSTLLGQTSDSQGVALGNGRPIGAQSYVLNVTGDFSVQNTCPNPMPPFVGCTVQVSFTPTQLGPRQGTLTIGFPGLSVQGTVALSGVGIGPLLQFSTSADVGKQMVGTTVEHDFALMNVGTANVTISSYAITGANASEFQVAAGQCSTIPPNATCNLKLNFVPSSAGVRTATLTLNDNTLGNPHTITLAGTGTADTIPPTTTENVSPQPNPAGWNNSNVTVTLNSTDNEVGGTGVKQITYSASGAQSIAGTVVPGSSTSFTISTEGITIISFSGTDKAGNVEVAKTLTIQLDKTPPTIACSASPNVLWPPNNKLVPINVSVNVADTLSGRAGFTLVSGTSNEPDGGQGDIQGFVTGTASTTGQLRAQRLGSGAGRVYTFTYSGMDKAANIVSCATTVTVPHDQRQK